MCVFLIVDGGGKDFGKYILFFISFIYLLTYQLVMRRAIRKEGEERSRKEGMKGDRKRGGEKRGKQGRGRIENSRHVGEIFVGEGEGAARAGNIESAQDKDEEEEE